MGVEEEEDFLFSQRLKSGTLPTCREARLANRVLTATWHKPPIQPTLPTPINGDGRGFGLVAEGRAASTVVACTAPVIPGVPPTAASSARLQSEGSTARTGARLRVVSSTRRHATKILKAGHDEAAVRNAAMPLWPWEAAAAAGVSPS